MGKPRCFDWNLLVLMDFKEDCMDRTKMEFNMEEFWIQIVMDSLKLMNGVTTKAIRNMVGRFVKVNGDDSDLRQRFMSIRVILDLSKSLKRGVMLVDDDNQT
ncbi:Uncharacterized protein TCM_045922 [Theobroma cacao]|uniref:DUF4283 domain-containing protein n=1 Tax=Theobroma cacao TaxID=3641 RepID=S1SI59_THECC|nr:Uncharacterized protein TCM_045922 [Theobroma cacao]